MIKRREWLKTSLLASTSALGFLEGIDVFGEISSDEIQQAADPKVKRLLFNENPLGPSKKVREIISETLPRASKYATFYKYDFLALKELIARQEGLKAENVLLGHGSFEPLIMVATHFGSHGGEIIVPSPSFDVVGNFGRKIGADVKAVEVDEDFRMNLGEMAARLSPKTKLLTICNPNNPTGTNCDPEQLKSFCRSVSDKAFVLLDEAYIHYLNSWRDHTMAPLIAEGKNVLVARTFSKIYGMAGLRIGYLLGPADFIAEMESTYTLGFPGNMPNSLSVAAAMASLEDEEFVKKSKIFNEKRKVEFYQSLDELDIPYLKSSANFVYFHVEKFNAYKSLMWEHKILLTGGWPTKPKWARVTMGSREDMNFLLEKMQGKKWM
ncbi:MAG: histidinol-phosphate transaminase [Bacteroidia bacterium]|nr:histidinol-phosphate transaminase [Bacteroidia bacterium]